jgi:hypothetical protein
MAKSRVAIRERMVQ